MRKIKEKYICKCNCGTKLVEENEVSARLLLFPSLKSYFCKKCKKWTNVHEVSNLLEFKPYPLITHKTEYDPRDNDHQ